MPASYNHHWSIFNTWKAWKAACSSPADSDVCSEDELRRIAQNLGIPAAQLRWVSNYSPDPISLLERRMEALSLDPARRTKYSTRIGPRTDVTITRTSTVLSIASSISR